METFLSELPDGSMQGTHKHEKHYVCCCTENYVNNRELVNTPVADPRGRPPSTDRNFLNFIQFLGKSGKFVCWRPPRGWRPLLRGILYPPLHTVTETAESNSIIGRRLYLIYP